MLTVAVTAATLDPLQATLRLEIDDTGAAATAPSYVIYRIGNEGGWRRLRALPRWFAWRYSAAELADGLDEIDVSELSEGTYVLQLRRVECGFIYQRTPSEVTFTIKRDGGVVCEELVRMCTSGDEAAETVAVRFLARHFDAFAGDVERRLTESERGAFLFQAARDRARFEQKPPMPVQPPLHYLVRHEDGREIWDFSEFPSLDPVYEKRMVVDANQRSYVSSLVFDGTELWFTHPAGIGALNIESGRVRWYGCGDGLPAWPQGGLKVAGAAELYASTTQGIVVYNPATDRFEPVESRASETSSVRALEADTYGRVWALQGSSNGGVMVNTGRCWLHSDLLPEGITCDASGSPWLLGVPEGQLPGEGFIFPGSALEHLRRLSRNSTTWPFIDYLGRLFVCGGVGGTRVLRYTWPEADGGHLESCEASVEHGVVDDMNREVWLEQGILLVNDTRLADPAIPVEEKWALPLPPTNGQFWRSLCFIDSTHVYLGSGEGLYFWNGEAWSQVSLTLPETAVEAPVWPHYGQPYWVDETFYRYEHSRRIEIADPFPGDRAPAGRFYDIEARNDGNKTFWLIEELAGGEKREYQFKGPFYYEPQVLFPDYEGNIWAAGNHYLYRFDGEQIATFTANTQEYFDNDQVRCFAADAHRNVWIGTDRGMAVFRDGKFVPPPESIPNSITDIVYDAARDRLIIAAGSNGLRILSDGHWSAVWPPRHLNQVNLRVVRSVSVSPDGTLWIATDAGAVTCSPDMRRWVHYGTEVTSGVVLGENGRVLVHAYPPYVLVPRDAAGE